MKTRGVPPSVQELAEVVGDEKAAAIVDAFAGTSWTIPVEPTLDHPWVEVVGLDDWIKLCFRCGGWRLRVPTCEYTRLQRRNEELAKLRRQGKHITELVRRFQLTEARIYQILKEYGDTNL